MTLIIGDPKDIRLYTPDEIYRLMGDPRTFHGITMVEVEETVLRELINEPRPRR